MAPLECKVTVGKVALEAPGPLRRLRGMTAATGDRVAPAEVQLPESVVPVEPEAREVPDTTAHPVQVRMERPVEEAVPAAAAEPSVAERTVAAARVETLARLVMEEPASSGMLCRLLVEMVEMAAIRALQVRAVRPVSAELAARRDKPVLRRTSVGTAATVETVTPAVMP